MNFLTFKEFCQCLKANPNTVKTWKKRGVLPAKIFFKIGGTLYILKDEFETWVKEKRTCEGENYAGL